MLLEIQELIKVHDTDAFNLKGVKDSNKLIFHSYLWEFELSKNDNQLTVKMQTPQTTINFQSF